MQREINYLRQRETLLLNMTLFVQANLWIDKKLLLNNKFHKIKLFHEEYCI
jgi:hypothetical protein